MEEIAMTKYNITDLIKFPVRADECSTYIWDADENMIAQVRGWGRLSYQKDGAEKLDFILNFIASAINNAQTFGELKAENERLKNSMQRIETDLTNGDFCRYVEHAQEHCGCEDIHKYFKEISAQEAE